MSSGIQLSRSTDKSICEMTTKSFGFNIRLPPMCGEPLSGQENALAAARLPAVAEMVLQRKNEGYTSCDWQEIDFNTSATLGI
jgi:hypothetical protein